MVEEILGEAWAIDGGDGVGDWWGCYILQTNRYSLKLGANVCKRHTRSWEQYSGFQI